MFPLLQEFAIKLVFSHRKIPTHLQGAMLVCYMLDINCGMDTVYYFSV